MRRYLAHRSLEAARIFRMLDLLISAAEIGFVWDGEQQGWIRAALPPLWMFTGHSNIFRAQFVRPDSSKLVLSWRIGKVFGVRSSWISEHLYNYLSLPTCGKEVKCCQGPFFVGSLEWFPIGESSG